MCRLEAAAEANEIEKVRSTLLVFPTCQSKFTTCHLGEPNSFKSPGPTHCNTGFSDTSETLEVEFAWGKGAPRVVQGLTRQQSYF